MAGDDEGTTNLRARNSGRRLPEGEIEVRTATGQVRQQPVAFAALQYPATDLLFEILGGMELVQWNLFFLQGRFVRYVHRAEKPAFRDPRGPGCFRLDNRKRQKVVTRNHFFLKPAKSQTKGLFNCLK